jgi:Amt family ammonium transporter
MIRKMISGMTAAGLSLGMASAAFAQAGPIKAPTAEQMATMVNKGDVAWMLVSAALVLMMSIPALALFYGGLVRTKNMLSVLMQVLMIVSVAALCWVSWGYSMAFTGGSPYVGGLSKMFLAGVSTSTYAATFSNNVYLPEYVYVIFQMTFACITPALIVGAFAERVKFTPLMIFTVLWLTLVYFPMAHMVWYFAGPDFLSDNTSDAGLIYGWGGLDFAGGTVVHINAGIAGLVGCLVIGKRLGFGKEATPPHSLTMTMIGASLLWVGWFGFNAGSGLESNAATALAFINTFVATAAAAVSWSVVEQIKHGKPSMLGAASGAVAGLVAITPAAGLPARWARSSSAWSSRRSASSSSPPSRMPSSMTTRSTCSACTASAGSSAPSALPSSPTPRWVARAGSTTPCSPPRPAPMTWSPRSSPR